ncbi:MAG: hypothetical protein KGZ97_07710 [Bacteroidetes bacterium]|nr:hypothetical protein [Bacteroidota bacterium]
MSTKKAQSTQRKLSALCENLCELSGEKDYESSIFTIPLPPDPLRGGAADISA